MFHLILFEPEIPPNTGNAIRLAANTGCWLHLVEPLGFDLSEKSVRRAGLDYHAMSRVQVHATLALCLAATEAPGVRTWACTTHGDRLYSEIHFQPGDRLLFGAESRGLPETVREAPWITARMRIPMQPDNRSMNLSNAVAVVTMEAWRQQGFSGGASSRGD